MFESLPPAPRDAILGLTEAFQADPNAQKINLTVGVYKDTQGRTPVLDCVRAAQQKVLDDETSKGYLGIAGSPQFATTVQGLLLGADHAAVTGGRVATAHTPGGTGALRVAADLLKQKLGAERIWLSDPTWPNHPAVFAAAGLKTETYPYFDAAANGLRLDAMLDALATIPQGDVVLLHACCHNPTGVDPTPDEWQRIAKVVADRQLVPLVDFAYQGFADGLEEDRRGLATLAAACEELIVASSFSKNFGLYNERVGALSVIAADADAADRALGHLKTTIRTNYSNPPAHGSAIVTTILSDEALTQQWHQELAAMRERINGMRKQFAQTLTDKGAPGDWSFMTRQRGMFSFSGLTGEQVDRLKEEFAIYVVRSGRINVAGITPDNLDRLCEAIKKVLT